MAINETAQDVAQRIEQRVKRHMRHASPWRRMAFTLEQAVTPFRVLLGILAMLMAVYMAALLQFAAWAEPGTAAQYAWHVIRTWPDMLGDALRGVVTAVSDAGSNLR